MKRPSLLIVDPDVLARHPLAQYLRECGYKVLEAATADEVRQLLQHQEALVETVLVDLDGSGDGSALQAWIRQTYPGVSVVLAKGVADTAEEAGHLCQQGPCVSSSPDDHQRVVDEIRRLHVKAEEVH